MSEELKPTYPGGAAFGALLELSHANADGRAPSARAVKLIAEGFERWLAEDGHRTFDEIVGFAGAGKGKAPFVERLRQRMRDLFIAHLVSVLQAAGFSVAEASELVSVAVNRSTDTLLRKQCRQLGLNPPAAPRNRAGAAIEHLPAKSIKAIFEGIGGATWARTAGYFGADCDERLAIRNLDLGDLNDARVQENLQFLSELEICRSFPFRSLDELRPVLPLDGLPKDLANRLRGK